MRFKYCKNCKYLFYDLFESPLSSRKDKIYEYGKWRNVECNHPKNLEKTIERTFYKESEYIEFLRKPSEINKNNDCPFFEEGEHISRKIIRDWRNLNDLN